jgi:hypothetical protein
VITKHILGIPVLTVKEVYLTEITPEDARRLLELADPDNRKFSPTVVDRYARDMASGNWDWDTNEILAFGKINDKTGLRKLVDGENRLRSIVKANVPVKMLVMLDVKTHHGVSWLRRFEQVLRMVFNIHTTRRAIEIVKAMCAARGESRMSPVEVRDVYEQHSDALEFAISCTASHRKGVTQAPIAAVYARAWYHEDHDRIREFAQVMQTGIYNGPEDLAAQRFREQVDRGVVNTLSGGSKRVELHRRCERALKAFCDRVPLEKIYASQRELYPLPEERMSKQVELPSG